MRPDFKLGYVHQLSEAGASKKPNPQEREPSGRRNNLRVEISDLSRDISFAALPLFVDQNLHMCKGEVGLRPQEAVLEDLVEVSRSEDFGRVWTQ